MSRTLNPQLFGPLETPVVKIDGEQISSRRFGDLEAQISIVDQKLERWAQKMEKRFEHLTNAQKALSEQMGQVVHRFNRQQAGIMSKLNEHRLADGKTQELFDRHNQMIFNFENRVHQIQKLSQELEMKLMTYQATYDEVLKEIRSLKNK